jgi:hypothetical protein
MILVAVDWADLAHEREKWWAIMNTAMNGCRKIGRCLD